MNEQWNNRDLELVVEKKQKGEPGVTKDEWSHHIVKLKEGEEIKWSIRHGFYHPPYEGDASYQVTLKVKESVYAICELPPGIRTMQQTDHDAWEYAVRNGLI